MDAGIDRFNVLDLFSTGTFEVTVTCSVFNEELPGIQVSLEAFGDAVVLFRSRFEEGDLGNTSEEEPDRAGREFKLGPERLFGPGSISIGGGFRSQFNVAWMSAEISPEAGSTYAQLRMFMTIQESPEPKCFFQGKVNLTPLPDPTAGMPTN